MFGKVSVEGSLLTYSLYFVSSSIWYFQASLFARRGNSSENETLLSILARRGSFRFAASKLYLRRIALPSLWARVLLLFLLASSLSILSNDLYG